VKGFKDGMKDGEASASPASTASTGSTTERRELSDGAVDVDAKEKVRSGDAH
jgi:hypothetical protein